MTANIESMFYTRETPWHLFHKTMDGHPLIDKAAQMVKTRA